MTMQFRRVPSQGKPSPHNAQPAGYVRARHKEIVPEGDGYGRAALKNLHFYTRALEFPLCGGRR